jgi:hypothetical protein
MEVLRRQIKYFLSLLKVKKEVDSSVLSAKHSIELPELLLFDLLLLPCKLLIFLSEPLLQHLDLPPLILPFLLLLQLQVHSTRVHLLLLLVLVR